MTIGHAIIDADQIPSQQWSSDLRQAIIFALKAEYRRDEKAREEGRFRHGAEPHALFLAMLALKIQDPTTVPALVLVVNLNSDVPRALAAFGRPALSDLMTVAFGHRNEPATASLTAIRFMIEDWGLEYFSQQERADIKSLVAAHLSPDLPTIKMDWPTASGPLRVEQAATLALVLQDAETRSWVERIAANQKNYRQKTGDKESRWMNKILSDLQRYLANEPLNPQRTPLNEFRRKYGWTAR